MVRLVIILHSGRTITREKVVKGSIKKNGDSLFFLMTGYAGDTGRGLYHDIAGYEVFETKEVENGK